MTDQEPPRIPREPRFAREQVVNILQGLNETAPHTISRPEHMVTAAALRNTTEAGILRFINQQHGIPSLNDRDQKIRSEILNQTGNNPTDEEVVTRLFYDALAAARKINTVKAATIGIERQSPASDALETLVVEQFAWYTGTKYAHLIHDNPIFVNGLLHAGEPIIEEPNNLINWYAPKMIAFGGVFLDAAKFCRKMTERETSIDSDTELAAANDALFDHTNDIRRYGVKPAIAPALPGSDMNEFLVSDPTTEAEQIKGTPYERVYRLMPKPIARFAGTTGHFLTSRTEYEEIGGEQKGARMVQLSFGNAVAPGNVISYAVGLSENGQLLSGTGLPIKQFLENAGMNTLGLETLRAEILSMYAETVAPAFVAQRMHEATQRPPTVGTGDGDQTTPQEPFLRRLILARTKILEEQHDEMLRVLESGEDAPPSTDQEAHAAQKVRHGVVGHLRTLAPHQKATIEARQLAWEEERLELPEYGLTYVKRHRRGTQEDRSLGHRVSRRQPPGRPSTE